MSAIAAVIADIHCGHPAALWPREHVCNSGNVIAANAAQLKLLEYWRDFWSHAAGADYVINLAESIEGYSPREHGSHNGVMTPDLDEQIRAVVSLIAPEVKKAEAIYLCVEGSKYHGSQDVMIERIICGEVQAQSGCHGHYFGYLGVWHPADTEQTVLLTHKISGGMIYKAGPLDRWSLYISSTQHKTGISPGLVLSAHDHQFFITSTAHRIMVKAPSWKFWHPIKDASRWPFSQPTIGGLVIKIPERGRMEVIPYTYPLEHLYDAMMEM